MSFAPSRRLGPTKNFPDRRSSCPDRKGFVLATVVFAIAIMSVVVVAALSASSDEGRASRAVRESTLATYAAEAGLRRIYGVWPTASVNALDPGDSLDLGWETLPNRASYHVVIHRVDAGGLQEYAVVVQGRRVGLNGGVSTLVGAVGGVPVFSHGIFAQTNIALGGNGVIDAYDSEEAAYNSLASDTTANIWSNGTIDIQKTVVYGDAHAAGAINVGSQVNIIGGATPFSVAAPPMDLEACPSGGYSAAADVPTGPGVTYNPLTGVLVVTAGAAVNLDATQYYFSQVILQGNSSILVNPEKDSHVEIVIDDMLNISGGSVTNL